MFHNSKSKKVLGIVLIIVGLGCISAGAFCLKSPGENDAKSTLPTNTTSGTTSSSDKPKALTADESNSTSDENHAKGLEFEKYIVNRFGTKYWSIKEWRSDKGVDGRYAESNTLPDLEMKLSLKDSEHLIAIECKWRKQSERDGNIKWSYPEQIKRYNEYSSSKDIPVFIALGIGGTPSSPEKVYLIPLADLHSPTINLSDYSKYLVTSERTFFYDTTKQDFKRN